MPNSTLIPSLGGLGSFINPSKQQRAPCLILGHLATWFKQLIRLLWAFRTKVAALLTGFQACQGLGHHAPSSEVLPEGPSVVITTIQYGFLGT